MGKPRREPPVRDPEHTWGHVVRGRGRRLVRALQLAPGTALVSPPAGPLRATPRVPLRIQADSVPHACRKGRKAGTRVLGGDSAIPWVGPTAEVASDRQPAGSSVARATRRACGRGFGDTGRVWCEGHRGAPSELDLDRCRGRASSCRGGFSRAPARERWRRPGRCGPAADRGCTGARTPRPPTASSRMS